MVEKKPETRAKRKIRMVLPKAHHHTRGATVEGRAGEDLIITWYQLEPFYVEGTKNPGTTVNCVLSGPINASMPAEIDGDTLWSANFAQILPPGTYDFEAEGSDDSSCGVSINVLPGAFPP
jgi:hypothetical protein